MKIISRRVLLTSSVTLVILASFTAYNVLIYQDWLSKYGYLKKFLINNGYLVKSISKKSISGPLKKENTNLAIINDFSVGNIIEVNGWIFSETEINLALTRK
jgi:hypothetical protein